MNKFNNELLFSENKDRFVLFPINYEDIWKLGKKHLSAFWTAEEIDFSKDKREFKKLDKNTKHFIKMVLAFFAASDGIVMENLITNFMNKFQIPEIRYFYAIQNFMESIHNETYSLLIDTYIDNRAEKNKMFKAIENYPAIKKKADWALKWMGNCKILDHINETSKISNLSLIMNSTLTNDKKTDNEMKKLIKQQYELCQYIKKKYNYELEKNVQLSLIKTLVAFACVEGIFFSGSFCCIYWIKEQGDPLTGLSLSNDFISRDEGIHQDFACHIYNEYVQNKLSEKIVHSIVKEAVTIEKEFIIEALPCKLLGMDSTKMSEYIEYIANRLLAQLNYKKLYLKAKQPFRFMDRILLENKTNFFEKRVSEYSKPINIKTKKDDDKFEFDYDF